MTFEIAANWLTSGTAPIYEVALNGYPAQSKVEIAKSGCRIIDQKMEDSDDTTNTLDYLLLWLVFQFGSTSECSILAVGRRHDGRVIRVPSYLRRRMGLFCGRHQIPYGFLSV
jgi:hypothetical protein